MRMSTVNGDADSGTERHPGPVPDVTDPSGADVLIREWLDSSDRSVPTFAVALAALLRDAPRTPLLTAACRAAADLTAAGPSGGRAEVLAGRLRAVLDSSGVGSS